MKTAHDVIVRPIITEASMQNIALKKYTFEVAKVNTINVSGKMKRQGMKFGYTPDWKKAIVTLTEDSKTIEFFDSMM